MNGGKECSLSDQGGCSLAAQVPVGWERRVDQDRVAYISPSGTVLSSVQQVRTYLLTEGACKCGLECPLILHKVFSFDPGASVKRRTAEDVKADEDVLKLCNHKRKIIAMATLHKSLETTHSSLTLSSPTTGGSCGLLTHTTPPGPALGKPQHSLSPEYKNVFLSKLMGAPNSLGRPFQPVSSPDQQHDPHSGYPRQRHGSSDHRQTSPCSRHRGDPPSPMAAGTASGTLSPRLDGKGRCETFARTYSPFNPELHSGSVHLHQNPLMAVGLPQKSQALLSHGMISPPPPLPPLPRSPNSPLLKNSCGFAANAEVAASGFQKRSPCPVASLQNPKQSFEKDPLCILDLICGSPEPSVGGCLTGPAAQPSSLHSQVAALNVNVAQPAPPPPPPSLSHLPSPAHGASHPESSLAPAVGVVKRAPQRSRPSSTSSDQEGYTPTGQQTRCSTPKPHSRSPRSLNSPKPSLPPSPKAKVDGFFQQYKELSGPLFAAAGNAASHQSLPLHLPAPTDNVPQPMKPPGLLGMPLNEIFSQPHNAAFFPASSLLSAAAKAQLASQNKMAAGGGYHHATATGNHRNPEIQSTLPNHFSPAPNRLLPMADPSRGPQRDKLPPVLAPHKDLSKKRKTATPTVLSMLKQSQTNLSNGSKFEAEVLRNQWPNLSLVNQPMSQLLHSLSAQSSQANSNNSSCHINSVSFPPCTNNQFSIVASNLNPSPVQNLPVVNVPVGSVGETASSQSLSTNLLSNYQEANSHLLGLVGQLALCSPGLSSGSAPVLKIPASTLLMLPPGSSSSSQTLADVEGTGQSVSISIAGKGHPAITKTTSVLNPGVIVTTTVDGSLPSPLPLADAFAFINQDQVLPFGHSTSPSGGQSNPLNPNLLSSLPISLALNQQSTLNQNPLQLVPAAVEGQGDGMLNLLGLLNPTLNPALSPNSNDLDGQTLQALQILMAALHKNQSQASLLPLASLNLSVPDLVQQQTNSLPSVIQLPTLQDHLSSVQAAGERADGLITNPLGNAFGGFSSNDGSSQSLLFPTASSTPALLALNQQLLAALLSSSSDNVSQPQVCLSAVSLGSATPTTSASPTLEGGMVLPLAESLLPLANSGTAVFPAKLNPLTPHLLNPLLGASFVGDLSALSQPQLQAIVGGNSMFLQNQQPLLQALQGPLGIQMFQSQLPIPGPIHHTNPLSCLFHNVQVNVGQSLNLSKLGNLPDPSAPLPETSFSSLIPSHHHSGSPSHQPQQHKVHVVEPDSVCMDALYNTVLDVVGKGMQMVTSTAPNSIRCSTTVPAFSTASAFTASISDSVTSKGQAMAHSESEPAAGWGGSPPVHGRSSEQSPGGSHPRDRLFAEQARSAEQLGRDPGSSCHRFAEQLTAKDTASNTCTCRSQAHCEISGHHCSVEISLVSRGEATAEGESRGGTRRGFDQGHRRVQPDAKRCNGEGRPESAHRRSMDPGKGGLAEHSGQRTFRSDSPEEGHGKGFPAWVDKPAGLGTVQQSGQERSEEDKVIPENMKTLLAGLEAPHRTRKRSKNTPKMNSNLEVALQEAMMELDQITANADQPSPKEKTRKPMKSKRRKIIR